MSTTVRISESTHQNLRHLSQQSGLSIQKVIEAALEEYSRRQFWEAFQSDVAAIRDDPKAWDAEQEERKAWDATLGDGLEDD